MYNEENEKLKSEHIVVASTTEELNRYSDAAQEYVKAYTGYDGTNNRFLARSLKSIRKQKVNQQYYETNIKQQAGFSAEVLDVANKNAKSIIEGEGITYSRVDDVPGRPINETAYDITVFDAEGKEILSKSAQMKFTKSNSKSMEKQLVSKEFQERYPHGSYSIPKDRFDDVKQELQNDLFSLDKQIRKAKEQGNYSAVNKLQKKRDYVAKVNNNLQKSSLTMQEARVARLFPVKTTVKKMAKIGHEVGINNAKIGAAIGGLIEFSVNIDKVLQGKMTAAEAAKRAGKKGIESAGKSYAIAQANTLLASTMKNSSKELLRDLGKSNFPAAAIMMTTEIFSAINQKLDGEISDYECYERISKSSLSIVGSMKASVAVGNVVAGPFGAIVGSLVAGVVINCVSNAFFQDINAPYYQAKEKNIRAKMQLRRTQKQIEIFHREFERTYIRYTEELKVLFGESLSVMAQALKMNDPDRFIATANKVTTTLGGEVQFQSVSEFKDLLDSKDKIII